MEKVNTGTNEDGTPRFHYHAPGKHVVYVGRAINGSVKVGNKTVDLGEDYVVADSEEHAAEIAHAIGEHLAENGHPTDPSYKYTAPKGRK
jgi:hypothetical protein